MPHQTHQHPGLATPSATRQRVLGALLALISLVTQAMEGEVVSVRLQTELGDITIALDLERAPVAAGYLLQYIDGGRYDGATLYRAASMDGAPEPQLVQGGLLLRELVNTGKPDLASYNIVTLPEFETTGQSGLRHTRGTVSLARDLLVSGDVIPEIVFYLRDAPRIDEHGRDWPDTRGFPAIGEVATGMDVIEAITHLERGGDTTIDFLRGQILTEPVRIDRAHRIVEAGDSNNNELE